jgi:hypothetical protein
MAPPQEPPPKIPSFRVSSRALLKHSLSLTWTTSSTMPRSIVPGMKSSPNPSTL